MAETTGIAWCDHTFNATWGCQKISPGCKHCYADTLSQRFEGDRFWGPASTTPRKIFGEKHWNDPFRWNRRAARDGVIRRVFACSMCDIFEDHPTVHEARERLWPIIRATTNLEWLLLTKRMDAAYIRGLLPADWGTGYPNVRLGTSVENQEWADRRVPELAKLPAAGYFLSCEPLLGPVSLQRHLALPGPDGRPIRWWVIVGGESQPGARPMELDWARTIRDEVEAVGGLFKLKQLGGHPDPRDHERALLDGRLHVAMPEHLDSRTS